MKAAIDFRYPSETEPYCASAFVDLSERDVSALKNRPAQIFVRTNGGKLVRIEPESIRRQDGEGKSKLVRTGIISDAYAAKLIDQIKAGNQLVVRRFQPKGKLKAETGFVTRRTRGDVFPVTYLARLECNKAGLNDGQSIRDKIKICGQVMRGFLKQVRPIARRVKRGIGSERATVSVWAHNVVIAPHPSVLEQIRRQGLPVDDVLELAARRAVEQLERKTGAKIIAFGGVHLEDSTTVRPHLHLRLAAYNTDGRYIALFDRKQGSRAGNRVVFQDEIERQILRQIERRERMETRHDRIN